MGVGWGEDGHEGEEESKGEGQAHYAVNVRIPVSLHKGT